MLKKKLYLILLFFLILIPCTYGIGVGSFIKYISFSPNLNENYEAFVINNVGTDIRVKLDAKGELIEYVTFSEEYMDIPAGGKKFFSFNLKLPESITPGRNVLMIGATDVTPPPPGSGGIRAVTAAYKVFIITAPYPGKYLEADLSFADIEEGEIAKISVNLVSKGKETINSVEGIIEIFDSGKNIDVITLDKVIDLKPGESRKMIVIWDSKDNKAGEYEARATLTYDGIQILLNKEFRIGTLLVKIINYTREFYQDEINKFDVEVESSWNINIDELYGEIEIGEQKIETLKTSLAPWGRKIITAYWDTANVDLGVHIADIKIHYAERVSEESIAIMVLPKREKIIELPSKLPSTTILLIAIVTLLVVGNIFLMLYFMKKRKNASDNDISKETDKKGIDNTNAKYKKPVDKEKKDKRIKDDTKCNKDAGNEEVNNKETEESK